MICVRLTPHELRLAADVGVARQIEALRQGRPGVAGCDGADGWTLHVEGDRPGAYFVPRDALRPLPARRTVDNDRPGC